MNYDYYINVGELMLPTLTRPRLPRTVICDVDEWLPLITVECEV